MEMFLKEYLDYSEKIKKKIFKNQCFKITQ